MEGKYFLNKEKEKKEKLREHIKTIRVHLDFIKKYNYDNNEDIEAEIFDINEELDDMLFNFDLLD